MLHVTKNIILFWLVLISFFSKAQDCKYSVNEFDDFEKVKKTFTKPTKIGRSDVAYFVFQLRKTNDTKSLYLEYGYNVNCIDNQSYVMIMLANGDTLKINNSGKVDCGRVLPYHFILSQEDITKLTSSAIDKIRLYNQNEYVESAKIKKPNYFIENLKCII